MKRKTIIGSGIVLIGMLVSGLAASVAWFLAGDNTFKTDVNGSVVEEYFECGSGTKTDPFVITRPMHYYHLVEFFQRKTVLLVSDEDDDDVEYNVTFGTDYLYFRIGKDLDGNPANGLEVYDYDNDGTYNDNTSKVLNMAYFSGDNALMPIGTSECPFFGDFDGGATDDANAIKIQNLNIKSQEDVIVEGGSSLTTRYTSDVGMFGYVADNDGDSNTTSIKNIYIDGLDIDLTGAVAGKDAVDAESVSHSSEHDDKIYVGYIVGHMHTYTRYDSAGPTNSSPIHDVYVNNATIEGGAGATCNFGYVGHADTINGVSGDEIVFSDIIDELSSAAGGGGQGDDWGGSINMKSLNQRLQNMITSQNTIYAGGNRTLRYSDEYNRLSELWNTDLIKYYANRNQNAKRTFYRLNGSGKYSIYSTSVNLPGTCLPLLTESDEDFEPIIGNTGYIIGGSKGINSSGYYPFSSTTPTITSASYEIEWLSHSIGDSTYSEDDITDGNTGITAYNPATFEILTNGQKEYSADSFVAIKDSYNKDHSIADTSPLAPFLKSDATTPEELDLEKYDASRLKFHDVLSGSSFIHGLHFNERESAISTSNTFVMDKVKILGEEKQSYPFPKSCIDFNLKETGKINFFGGSYYAHIVNGVKKTGVDSFLSLYKIDRNKTTNALNAINQISFIYENKAYTPGSSTQQKYIYRYYASSTNINGVYSDTGTTSPSANLGNLVFDMRYITEMPPVRNAAYYFEIPVDGGEYAMGVVDGKNGGYLMYLDIGASGSEDQHDYNTDNMIANDPIFTQMEYVSSGFVINSCFNIAYVVPAGATKETFWVKVSRTGTVFAVEVYNTTGNPFTMYVLLVDNDSDPDNEYPYTYTLKYNTGAISSPYASSGGYTGTSGGTSLVPL